jgi:SAM-dependent methyltransferase
LHLQAFIRAIHEQERAAARENAPLYDLAYETAYWRHERRAFALRLKRHAMSHGIKMASASALDVGCGTGSTLAELKALGVEKLSAVDISIEMASIAAGKFPDVDIRVGPVEYTDFDAGEFDIVTGFSVLHHLPDLVVFFEWLAQVLRPGGVFAFSDPNEASVLSRPAVARWTPRLTFPLRRVLERRNATQIAKRPAMSEDRFYSDAHRAVSKREISTALPRGLDAQFLTYGVLAPPYSRVVTDRRLDRRVLATLNGIDRVLRVEGYLLVTLGEKRPIP